MRPIEDREDYSILLLPSSIIHLISLMNAACTWSSALFHLSIFGSNYSSISRTSDLNQHKSMIKVNWTKVAKVLKYIATIITTVLGTIAVQSCGSQWF